LEGARKLAELTGLRTERPPRVSLLVGALPESGRFRMNFPYDRPRLPSQIEIDSLYFHIWMLWIAGILLAFSLGFETLVLQK
jgi:hypothetical protein